MTDSGMNGDGVRNPRIKPVINLPQARMIKCSLCMLAFHTFDEEAHICPVCSRAVQETDRLAVEKQKITDNLDAYLSKALLIAGMSKREATASLDQIDPRLKRMLASGATKTDLERILMGEVPAHGFGLLGPTGIGKTFALAALFKNMTSQRWANRAHKEGFKATKQFMQWVRWPEQVNAFRTIVSSVDGGMQQVDKIAAAMSRHEVLVLDDLGAERMRADYAEDWASSVLDLIIDRRFNNMLPTWWTSNLTANEFIERYGTRLFSRLAGHNPPLQAPNGPDLRIQRKHD